MGAEQTEHDDPLIDALGRVYKDAGEGRYGRGVPLDYDAIEDDLNEYLSKFDMTIVITEY